PSRPLRLPRAHPTAGADGLGPAAQPGRRAPPSGRLPSVAKQRQPRMQQMQVGSLAAIQLLEDRTDEQLVSESKHRVAAKALLAARAAERYDAATAKRYFNEALAG